MSAPLAGQSSSDSGGDLLCNSSAEYFALMKDTEMEQYWMLIKPFSFQSEFLPLDIEATKQLMQLYKDLQQLPEAGKREKLMEIISPAKQKQSEVASAATVSSSAAAFSFPLLPPLVTSLADVFSRSGWNHFFLRLSSRSPKDAALSSPAFSALLTQEIERVREEHSRPPLSDLKNSEMNMRLHALYRASTHVLACSSAEEGVALLAMSERVQGDLQHEVEQDALRRQTVVASTTAPPPATFNVVLREFVKFPVEFEFRGFVYNKHLTGITQYNEFCFFPILHCDNLAQRMSEKIQAEFSVFMQAWETQASQSGGASPSVNMDHFIVDFVLAKKRTRVTPTDSGKQATAASEQKEQSDDKAAAASSSTSVPLADSGVPMYPVDLDEFQVYLIELNPFAEFAGAGLFSWDNEADKAQLMGKPNPKTKQQQCEFRYHQSLPSIYPILGNLAPDWRKFVTGKK